MDWLQVTHDRRGWQKELNWLIQQCKGKGWRASLLKLVITQTTYGIWEYRNDICFGNNVNTKKKQEIIFRVDCL